MKKMIAATLVAALAGLGGAAWAERPEGPGGPGGGPDRKGGGRPEAARLVGPGGPGHMAAQGLQRLLDNPKKMKELGISDAQAGALKESFYAMEKKMIALRAAADEAQLEVRKLMEKDDADEAALMAAIDKAGQARTEIQKAATSQRLAVKKILGPELSAKLKERMGEKMRERREEAMRPFTRLDDARNQNRGTGTGLGLAIAADIARSHGGTLRLGDSARLGGLKAELVLAR